MRGLTMLSGMVGVLLSSHAFAASVEWQVDHPFRFLRYGSDHTVHEIARDAARTLPGFRNKPVSTMESLLNDPDWWTTAATDGGSTPAERIAAMRFGEGRTPAQIDIRRGWASLLGSDQDGQIDSGTCWSASRQNYYQCSSDAAGIAGSNEYLRPQAHFVRISIAGADGTQDCSLEITSDIMPGTGFLEDNRKTQSRETAQTDLDCSSHVLARIPYGETITLKGMADGAALAPVTIAVRDILIASLGDSFASGEGNPDVPAKLDPEAIIRPRYHNVTGAEDDAYGVPRRLARPDGGVASGSAARWVDRRCHRSMYSAHTRAAIALSLSGKRHHAVTYVSFACSGAEITDGLFWPQDGQECTVARRAGTHFMEPQISALVGALGQNPGDAPNPAYFVNTLHPKDRYREDVIEPYKDEGVRHVQDQRGLCSNWPGPWRVRETPRLRKAPFARDIDLLMLSIGGNDMGFAPLVTSIVLRRGLTDTMLGDLMGPFYALAAGGISPSQARTNIRRLDGRFRMLAAGIAQKLEISDTSRVLMTAYPTPAFERPGKFCASGRRGMNASRVFDLAGPGETHGNANIEQAQNIVDMLNGRIAAFARQQGFAFVDSFAERFHEHGICARKQGASGMAEQFDLPHKATSGGAWRHYDPVTEFRAYASRQRWFRTFNDSFLTAFHFKDDPNKIGFFSGPAREEVNALYLAYRSLGGPVHPTAEGHAAIADSLYCAGAAKLFPDQAAAQCE